MFALSKNPSTGEKVRTFQEMKSKVNWSIVNAWICQINPQTRIGQKIYTVLMLLLPLLPIAALIIQNATSLNHLLKYQKEVEYSRNKVDGATHLEKFITNLQRERSEVAFYIFTSGKQSLGLNLSERFHITDAALDMTPWPGIKAHGERNMFTSKLRFQIRHGNFRQRISQDEEDINSVLNWYNSANSVFLNHLSTGIKTTNSSIVWKYLIAYVNLLRCIENLGIAVAYGIRYYGQGRITEDNYIQFIRHITLGDEYLKQSQNYVPYMRELYQGIQSDGGHYEALLESRKAVLAQVPQKANTEEALKFYQATYGYTEGLRAAIRDLRLRIKAIVVDELIAANRQQALGITVLISVLIISPIIIFLVRNATMTIKFFTMTIQKKGEELINEREKAQKLLFEILPRKFCLNILQNIKNDVQFYDSVSLLYSDVEDFFKIIEEYSPVELVAYINRLYKLLDCCIKKYEVFKVDNVNDSAIIMCGIEREDGTLFKNHISEIGTMALDLIGQASLLMTGAKPKDRLKLRIAIHTGPVLVGILHRPNHLPQFKLYGNSIIMAHNLLQTADALMIHISAETNKLLEECGGFRTEARETKLEFMGGIETFSLIDKDGGFLDGEIVIDKFIKQFDFYKSLNP